MQDRLELQNLQFEPQFQNTSDTQVFKRAIDMTDDELAAIAARAKLTVG